MSRFTLLLSLLFFYGISESFSQPTNNTCSGAIDVSYSGSCNFKTYTNDSATNSGNATSTCGGTPTNDVWFRVVVPQSGNLVFAFERIASFYLTISLYKGDCDTLTQYRCDDNSSTEYRMPYLEIHDTASRGDTLYLQVWGEDGKSGKFNMCVYEPAQPVNKVCETSINLSVKPTCGFTYYDNSHAGNSGIGTPSCGTFRTNDVWFNAVVPKSGRLILRTDNDGIGDAQMAVYTGDCDSLKEYACNTNSGPTYLQPQVYIFDTAMAGERLQIRIWKENSIYGGGFGICAYEPDVDSNNTVYGATYLDVESNCNYKYFDNVDYTDSKATTPPCGNYVGADIWFKTVVPKSGKLVLSVINNGLGDAAMAMYYGTKDSLKLYNCSNNEGPNYIQPEIIVNDSAMALDTVYVMLWKTGSIHSGSFGICCFEPDIPTNLDCINAIELQVNPSCNYKRFTNEYAGTSGDGLPTCGAYSGSDVWFKFQVPTSGKFTIDSRYVTYSDMAMSLYTGTCGALTQLQCDDNSSTNPGNMPRIVVSDTNLANQVLYLQFWRRGSLNGGFFDLCVFGDLSPEIRNPRSVAVCEGDSIPPLRVDNGVFQYYWYDRNVGGNLLAADTNQFAPGVSGTYYVEALNSETLQRSKRVAVTLDIYKKPKLVDAIDRTYCDGDTQVLWVQDLNSTYNWFLDSLGDVVLVEDTNRYYPSNSNTYYVQAIDSSTGCSSETRGLKLTVNPLPKIINLRDVTACDNNLPVMLSLVDSGATYSWFADRKATKLLGINISSYETGQAGYYYVKAVDPNTGCSSDLDSAKLDVLRSPEVIANANVSVCSADLPATLGVKNEMMTYRWYEDSGLTSLIENDAASIEVNKSGFYYVYAIGTNGCASNIDSIGLTVNTNPIVVNPVGFEGCDENNYTGLKVTDLGYQYNWYDSAIGGVVIGWDNAVVKPAKNGTYYVEAVDVNSSCKSVKREKAELLLYPTNIPLVSFDGSALKASSGKTFQWYKAGIAITGANDSVYVLTDKGDYYVVVTDEKGCEQQSKTVTIPSLSSVAQFQGTELTVFPNPTNGSIRIEGLDQNGSMQFAVVNVLGVKVYSGLLPISNEVDLTHLPVGLYVVNVYDSSAVYSVKIIKE